MNELKKIFGIALLLATTCVNLNVSEDGFLETKLSAKNSSSSSSVSSSSLRQSVKFVVTVDDGQGGGNATTTTTRRKRQSGGGSTSVIGARITREATAGDWQQANFALNDAAGDSPPSSRGKRSVSPYSPNNFVQYYGPPPATAPTVYGPPIVSNHLAPVYGPPTVSSHLAPVYGPPQYYHVVITKAPPKKQRRFLTRTQELFDYVNRNSEAAQLYSELGDVQTNKNLRDAIVVNPGGIKCEEICDPQGVGFALLGFCTENYCKCDFQTWRHTEYTCPEDKIFDPVKLICESPVDTLLCSDAQPPTFYGPAPLQTYGPVSVSVPLQRYGPAHHVPGPVHTFYQPSQSSSSYSYFHQPQPQSQHPVFTLLSGWQKKKK